MQKIRLHDRFYVDGSYVFAWGLLRKCNSETHFSPVVQHYFTIPLRSILRYGYGADMIDRFIGCSFSKLKRCVCPGRKLEHEKKLTSYEATRDSRVGQ